MTWPRAGKVALACAVLLLRADSSAGAGRRARGRGDRGAPGGRGRQFRLGTIAGRVSGAGNGQRIVLYARSGDWYVQPYADQPFTAIQPDSTWTSSTHLGTEYAALLVDADYRPLARTPALPGIGGGVAAVTVTEGVPPWWKTRWFRVACLAVAVLGAASAPPPSPAAARAGARRPLGRTAGGAHADRAGAVRHAPAGIPERVHAAPSGRGPVAGGIAGPRAPRPGPRRHGARDGRSTPRAPRPPVHGRRRRASRGRARTAGPRSWARTSWPITG